ncbi:MAG TPA: hypothetical protein VEG61_05090 [Candidatus Dormibacteraeota bacterium]|nr:hypothetical protein [Candidatus Dormibacteraeota bacterium]
MSLYRDLALLGGLLDIGALVLIVIYFLWRFRKRIQKWLASSKYSPYAP